jgi:hypothetical protein
MSTLTHANKRERNSHGGESLAFHSTRMPSAGAVGASLQETSCISVTKRKPVSFFPVFVVAHSSGLREACWPVSDSLQVRECAEEGESSWKEPCSCHRTRRLPVRSVPVTQGKGDWQPKDCLGDREGALSRGRTGMWGMRVCGQ